LLQGPPKKKEPVGRLIAPGPIKKKPVGGRIALRRPVSPMQKPPGISIVPGSLRVSSGPALNIMAPGLSTPSGVPGLRTGMPSMARPPGMPGGMKVGMPGGMKVGPVKIGLGHYYINI